MTTKEMLDEIKAVSNQRHLEETKEERLKEEVQVKLNELKNSIHSLTSDYGKSNNKQKYMLWSSLVDLEESIKIFIQQ